VKLRINPVTIPNGFLFPELTLPERTIGRIGRIHGERIVIIPARKANVRSNIIFFKLPLIPVLALGQ
jgi:hypothetical protein